MKNLFTFTFALVGAALLSLPVAAQKVWVVDSDSAAGAHFSDIQPAVDAASDGDVVLIRHRTNNDHYGSFTIQSKSLTVIGQPDMTIIGTPGNNPFTGPIWVRNLSASQSVQIRALTVYSLGAESQPALQVTSCMGPVIVEDTFFDRDGLLGELSPTPTPVGVFAIGSRSLVFSRSAVRGENGYLGLAGGTAALFVDTAVTMHDSLIRGGDGAVVNGLVPGIFSTPTTAGGDGVVISGGSLQAFGGFMWGGAGGWGKIDSGGNCFASSNGGTALRLVEGIVDDPLVTLTDVDLRFGSGGGDPGVNCGAGLDGALTDIQAGNLALDSELPRGFTIRKLPVPDVPDMFVNLDDPITWAVREGQSVELTFTGMAGDFIWAVFGQYDVTSIIPGLNGPFHLVNPAQIRFLGKLGGSKREISIPIMELGAGVESVSLAMQGIFFDSTTGRFISGDPSTLVLLDRSF